MKTIEQIREKYNSPENYNSVTKRYEYCMQDVDKMLLEYGKLKYAEGVEAGLESNPIMDEAYEEEFGIDDDLQASDHISF